MTITKMTPCQALLLGFRGALLILQGLLQMAGAELGLPIGGTELSGRATSEFKTALQQLC